MKFEFSDVIHIFENYKIFVESRENLWYEKSWKALDNEGLTSYENLIEEYTVIIRAYTLIMLYMEFSDLVFGETCYYKFDNWEEISGLSSFRIGQIASKILEGKDYFECDEYEALQYVFRDMVFKERDVVVDALTRNFFRGKSEILVALFLTVQGEQNEEYEGKDLDEELEANSLNYIKKLTDYEQYQKEIDEEYYTIINDITSDKLKVYSWLDEGTFIVGQIC